MYGFIYNTLRNLVIENFGPDVWRDICDEAQVDEMKEGILDRHYYDESYLYTIGKIASSKLGLSLEEILEKFGAFFFVTCKKSGHSSMLRTLGHNLYGFLMNLDSLHDHLSFMYTQMQAPSFRCEKTQNGLILHYYSQRPGLSNIVIGIVKAVSEDFYNLDINIKEVMYENTGEKLQHHYVFNITVMDSTKNENYLERLTGDFHTANLIPVLSDEETSLPSKNAMKLIQGGYNMANGCPVSNRSHTTGQHINNIFADSLPGVLESTSSSESVMSSDMTSTFADANSQSVDSQTLQPRFPAQIQSCHGTECSNWPITTALFQTYFPFHVIFDKDLHIRYMGISLTRIFPKAISNGTKLMDYFDLSRPAVELTYSNIHTSLHNVFIMSTKKPVTASKSPYGQEVLQFRGQMIPTSSREGADILFLGSPRISNIEELEHQGLYLSDIPIHDVTRDLLLLNNHFRVEMSIATELELTKKDLQIQKSRVEQEKQRADQLLHSMLPPTIASQLKSGDEVTAISWPSVTILFSDIKGFTTICNSCQPMQVVGMLNSLYTLFDSQSEKHGVYKVETIGDAYMVASGLLDTPTEHSEAVINMAFGMREEAGKVMEPNNQSPLQIRIGVHTGSIVAGVVGRRMPRYCLFGDTVNTASRMESHGEPGRVHISEATYNQVKDKSFTFYSRGKIRVKGLGERLTYFVEPHDASSDSMLGDKLVVRKPSDSVSFTEYNLVQLPPIKNVSSFHTSSSFVDDSDIGSSDPMELKMVKPNLFVSEENHSSPHNTSELFLDPVCATPTPSLISPPVTKVTPTIILVDTSDNEESPRKSSALFMTEQKSSDEEHKRRVKKSNKKKGKCLIT